MGRNPFEKFLVPEDHLQMQVARYMAMQYPKVFWCHTPNEGKRSPYEQCLVSPATELKYLTKYYDDAFKWNGKLLALIALKIIL